MKDKNKEKLAVALQYDSENDEAPVVIAKGKGDIAEKIIEKGNEEGISTFENQELAESLMMLNIDEEIPEELYTAVAEIMLFIYKLDEEEEEWWNDY
ncbi:hypothetical protein CLPU_5c01020 [Gottschalkia purinilytica]|uniref:Flagellar biosynthesis protein FlhB n=1 Tax=Gottschalkia purinilytica TaxID=1503 RepID=A0A0L0WBR6_GOTPU|nr:EscU/YscU/HrcU family type III secretion system export apparatus switch protein [Gottschalkia purinilytica]KNF08795.1 hypothetical protein CLPU_5c01020 [Gottschalkia purinilytica]